MADKSKTAEELRDLSQIDRMVHEPARLMILMVLYTVEDADFTFLVNATELTDGNLSSHLTKLEDAGYVEIEKGYAGKKPRTTIRLKPEGRKAIEDYRSTMESALKNLS
ncbi:MAG: transcriptional regulator [Anaerolineales bacterium]|jgi:DNA-binding MarR family transcriptional regulator